MESFRNARYSGAEYLYTSAIPYRTVHTYIYELTYKVESRMHIGMRKILLAM